MTFPPREKKEKKKDLKLDVHAVVKLATALRRTVSMCIGLL